jgi:hypothetical protein
LAVGVVPHVILTKTFHNNTSDIFFEETFL